MEDLMLLFQVTREMMSVSFDIYGFQLSWWDIFIWSSIAVVVGWFVVRFLYD